MMKNKKKLVAIVIVLTMMLSLFSVAYAKGTYQTLNAWYGDIKIVANGKQVVSSIKPFMVNDTTYVPIRMLGEALGKTVSWDGSTYSVIIADKPDPTDTLLWQQLFDKDKKINELEKKIALLESEKDKSVDLDDLEDDLMDDYEEYKDIEFDISIDGDEDDIEVEIYVDLSDYKSKWNRLKQSDIEDYLQDIVDDILDEFDDADITGFIEDDDSGDELLEFTVSSKGKVSVSYKNTVDLDDLERNLNRWYGSYRDLDIDIYLDGEEDDITVEIYVSKSEWNVLDDYAQAFLDAIVDDILDEFKDADVDGFIEDDSSRNELLTFFVRSNGTVIIE